MGEDVAQDVVGVNCPRDFTEVMQRLPCVHSDQVARHVVGQSIPHGLKRGIGRLQCFEMAQIGHHELMSLVILPMLLDELAAQDVKALSCGG